MLDLLQTYSLEEIAIFIVMLALAVKGVVDFLDWVKHKYQEKFKKDFDRKTQETLTQEHYAKCQERYKESIELYDSVNKKLDVLTETVNKRLDEIEDSIQKLTESDMHDIKGWIVERHHHYMQKQWIDDFTMDTLEKRFFDYTREGGNSYIHNLMEELRALPHVPPKGKD